MSGYTRALSRQRLSKHVPAAADTNTKIEELFSLYFLPRYYKQGTRLELSSTRVEASLNTSTVTLRVVGGDEKESLKSETLKYDHESQETRTRKRLRSRGPAAYTKERPVPSSGKAPQKNKPVTVKE
jgi:hypothetical protein